MNDTLSVILTGYKRDYFEEQIPAILNQTLKPDVIYLWQNENHIDLSKYRKKYGIKIVQSDENMKFFGRFTYAMLMKTKYVAIFDDDIIPGKNFLKNCMNLSKNKNCIVGQNFRNYDEKKQTFYANYPINDKKVHIVGHCWFFKKEWLKYMWNIEPYTFDNGEDIHFCMSAKLFGNIDSYVVKQIGKDNNGDLKRHYASDKHASHKLQKDFTKTRIDIVKFFIKNGWKIF